MGVPGSPQGWDVRVHVEGIPCSFCTSLPPRAPASSSCRPSPPGRGGAPAPLHRSTGPVLFASFLDLLDGTPKEKMQRGQLPCESQGQRSLLAGSLTPGAVTCSRGAEASVVPENPAAPPLQSWNMPEAGRGSGCATWGRGSGLPLPWLEDEVAPPGQHLPPGCGGGAGR